MKLGRIIDDVVRANGLFLQMFSGLVIKIYPEFQFGIVKR